MGDWVLPTIRMDRCDGCGLCVMYCPTHAVEMLGARPSIVRPRDCAYCGTCEEICPTNAIQLVYEIVWPSDIQIEDEDRHKRR